MTGWLIRGTLALFALFAVAALVVVSGVVPVTASSGHFRVTAWLLHFAMQRSVATHAHGIEPPPLDDPRLVMLGAGHYEGGCRFCHGAPGTRLPAVPYAMTPRPPELAPVVSEYDDAELFYIVKHGIKFTAMPAWPAHGRDDEVWAVVAFLRVMPKLSYEEYRALAIGDDALAHVKHVPEVVRERCARCHGIDGTGRGLTAFPKLAGQRAAYMREALAAYASGARQSGIMRPIAVGLGPDELRVAVAWYASQTPARSARTTSFAQLSAMARKIEHLPLCVACHGPGEAPRHAAFPRLAGQEPHYLEQQLRLLRAERRGGGRYLPIMETVAHWLPDQALPQLARIYASLPPEPPTPEDVAEARELFELTSADSRDVP